MSPLPPLPRPDELPTLARRAAQTATILARGARVTGLLAESRPRSLAATARALRKGGGPSAIFRIHAVSHPTRIAMVDPHGRALTYAEMDRRIDALAASLRARGAERGTTALSVLTNRPEHMEIHAAMSRLGGACVAASWRSTPHELAFIARDSGARWIFLDGELGPASAALASVARECVGDRIVWLGTSQPQGLAYESLVEGPGRTADDAPEGAVLIYTSGTTGRPKGAVRKFGIGQVEGYFAFVGRVPMRAGDQHLAVCPMYHSTGLGFVGLALMLGGTVHVLREFDPEGFLAAIERLRIQTTAVVPTMLHRLAALPASVFRRYDTRSLRAMFSGGAQLPGPLASTILDRFGPVLYNFYGSTETGLVTAADPFDLHEAPGTVGLPLDGVEVRILDESGAPVPRGSVGELFVRNAMLVEGYHGNEHATRESQREGFFSVGDLATMDAAGRIQIVGRRRDMIISGGVNVYPAEVEAVLDEHPDVRQSAVIGVPDAEWGERVRAFVVLSGDATADAATLRAWCRERLSGPKTPKEWVFMDSLPSNPTGKVLKRELREWQGDVLRV